MDNWDAMSEAEPDADILQEQGPGKRKRPAPTTQLTLAYYRRRGYVCDVAEHYNFYSGRRNDLFSFADIVAVDGREILFVQTTSRHNMSSRRNKIRGNPAAAMIAGLPCAKVILLGWYKNGARWACKEETIGNEKD